MQLVRLCELFALRISLCLVAFSKPVIIVVGDFQHVTAVPLPEVTL